MMRKLHCSAWLPLCLVFIALHARGAELSPYSLPSQQAQPRYEPRFEPRIEQRQEPRTEQRTEQRIAAPRISEEFYRNYAIQVRGLDPAQRQELLHVLERNFVQAFQAGRMDEARHYRRLIEIVQPAPTE